MPNSRLAILLALMLIIGAMVVGCPAADPEPVDPDDPDPVDPDEETVLEVTWREMSGLDVTVWTSRFDRMVMTQLYTPLIRQIGPDDFRPGLAEDWEVGENFDEITFYLRDDIDLTDGTHFDADLLVANWDRMHDPDVGSMQLGSFDDIESYEAIDDYTVHVKFYEPKMTIVQHFCLRTGKQFSVNSLDAAEELGDDYAMNPVSYGPYYVDEWIDDTTLVLRKNEDYQSPDYRGGGEGPHVDKIIFYTIEEALPRLMALEEGETNAAWLRGVEHEIPGLEADPNIHVQLMPVPSLVQHYNLNTQRSPTDELAVRRALMYAHDPEDISEMAFFGINPPAYAPLSSNHPFFSQKAADMSIYDPDKAREILDEAGWILENDGIRYKDGEPLTVNFIGTETPEHEVTMDLWSAIGVDATLEDMAYEAQMTRFADNNYHAMRLGLSGNDPAGQMYMAFHSTQIEGGGQFNRSRVEDDYVDELLSEGTQHATFEERFEIYENLQVHIMDQAYIIPNFEDVYSWGHDGTVSGWEFEYFGNPTLDTVRSERIAD